jgi:hypothetical protein
MSVSSGECFCVAVNGASAPAYGSGAIQSAPTSCEVAEVANRPKKRPGRRERSSITIGATRTLAMLVVSETMLIY